MSAIKFCSSFQNLFIKEDIGSPDARYRFTWMGEEAELGHVLAKLFVINLRHVVSDLSTAPSHGCHSAFTERYCIKVRSKFCPARCVRDVRDHRHFKTCFIKEDIGSPDAVPIHIGEEGGTWSRTFEAINLCHVVPDQSDVAGHSRVALATGRLLTERYRKVYPAPVLPELRADVRVITCSSFQNLFIKEDIGYPDEVPAGCGEAGTGQRLRSRNDGGVALPNDTASR
jgi:hypothetical protein